MTAGTTFKAQPARQQACGSAFCEPALVSLAAVTWNFALVGRTRMLAEAWQRSGRRQVFAQVPGLRTAAERLLGPFKADEPLPVVRPWPAYPERWWSHISERRYLRLVRKRAADLRRQLSRHVPLEESAAIVVSPRWLPWLDHLPVRTVVYDCIDDVRVHAGRPETVSVYRRWEAELIERADGVVTTAAALARHVRQLADVPVELVRNGVDAQWFARQAERQSRPGDLPRSGRPLVGFVGALYGWIDWPLVGQVAAALPEFDFVFVGPIDGRSRPGKAAELANVHLLGRRPHQRVPAYVAAFDVCWVPFDATQISRLANPVKIYEYLALGKPVVSTPVADVESFEGLVQVGADAPALAAALRSALEQRDESAAARRREFARRNSWDARAEQFARFVDRLAGGKGGWR